jgi:large subunit ribosomal protein L53
MAVSKFQHSVQLFSKLYGNVPAFVDVFDEESFYIFSAAILVVSIIVAIVLSRYVTIKETDW